MRVISNNSHLSFTTIYTNHIQQISLKHAFDLLGRYVVAEVSRNIVHTVDPVQEITVVFFCRENCLFPVCIKQKIIEQRLQLFFHLNHILRNSPIIYLSTQQNS